MKAPIDIVFLAISKWLLIAVMTIAMLTTIGFSIYAGVSYLNSEPREIAVESKPTVARQKEDFVTEMLRGESPGPESPEQTEESRPSNNLRYTPQATNVIQCLEEYRLQVGELSLSAEDARNFRNELEGLMEEFSYIPGYGDEYVNSLRRFLCDVLEDRRVVRRGVEGDLGPVFQPALEFFNDVWAEGVKKENDAKAEESARALASKQMSIFSITVAGTSLALFVILSFYLMFAKMESNLRGIVAEISTLRRET